LIELNNGKDQCFFSSQNKKGFLRDKRSGFYHEALTPPDHRDRGNTHVAKEH